MEVPRLGSIAYYVEQLVPVTTWLSALLPLLSAFLHQPFHMIYLFSLGAIQVLRNAVGGGRVSYSPEKCYEEDVRFKFISVTRG